MAFALAGSTITQSGTDANLSGLAAIPGVVATTRVGHTTYVLEALQINVTGNLSINPALERLVFGATHPTSYAVQVSSGGVLNVGTMVVQNGEPTYSSGLWLHVAQQGAHFSATGSLLMLAGSTFNWMGGEIDTASSPGFRGTCNFGQGEIHLRMGSAGQRARVFCFDAAAISSLTLQGNGVSLDAAFTGSLNNCRVVDGQHVGIQGALLSATISDYDYVGRGQLLPAVVNAKWVARNAVRGTATLASTSAIPARVLFVKNASFVVRNLGGSPIAGATIYTREYIGADRPAANFIPGDDFTAPVTSVQSTNGSGIAAFSDWRLGLLYRVNAGFTNLTTWGKNNSTDDVQDFAVWAYPSLPQNIDVALKGAGTLTTPVTLLNDPSVSLSEAAAGALTSIATLDNLYDAAKHWKTRPIAAQIEYPSKTTQPVNANGTVLDLGSRNLVIDASASAAFAVNTATNTITVKSASLGAGSKFRTLITTGSVSFAGGAVIAAPYTDAAGSSAQLVLQCLAGSTVGVFDGTGAQRDYGVSVSGNYVLNIAPGAAGTWTWVADQPGYVPSRGTFSPGGGGIFSASASQPQKINPDGSPMYQGTTSPLVSVSFSGTTAAYIDIGNGSASLQAVFDESEQALVTQAGIQWLASGKSDLSQFNSGAGDFLFMSPGWRLRRAAATDSEATIQAFVQSAEGLPVDEANGPVRFLSSDSPAAIAAAVRTALATELARLDVAVSSRESATAAAGATSTLTSLVQNLPLATDIADAVWAKELP